MDFPKSVPNIGLVGGVFVDEDQLAGTPGSLIPSAWGNAITQEVLNVISAAGLVPAEGDLTQLLAAIRKLGQTGAASYAADTGAANAFAVAYTPAITAPTDGMVLMFKAKNANTGACTFSTNGTTARAVVRLDQTPLQGGEIIVDSRCAVIYSSTLTSWVLLYATGGAPSFGTVATDAATDFNTITRAGRHPKLLGGAPGSRNANHPDGQTLGVGATNYYYLDVSSYGGNVTQLATPYLSVNGFCTFAFRTLAGGVWGNWRKFTTSDDGGRLINIQVFDVPGTFTYTPTPGMATVIAKLQGAGGPGAGLTTPSAGNVSMAAPGGSGSYAEARLTAAQIGASKPVVVGATGTVGLGISSTNGGSTSLGALVSAQGGLGGVALNNVVPGGMNGNGGLAGTPSGANITKSIGNCTSSSFSISASIAFAGAGGKSVFGDGGSPPTINGSPIAGPNFGTGGSGCVAGTGGAPQTGALGGGGIAILMEYA